MNAARLIGILMLLGCTDESATKETLRKSGFSEVETLGYDAWACGKDDTYSTKFRAKNPQGVVVEGVVCCGAWAKACTVRF
jgi:hypothetical protein